MRTLWPTHLESGMVFKQKYGHSWRVCLHVEDDRSDDWVTVTYIDRRGWVDSWTYYFDTILLVLE